MALAALVAAACSGGSEHGDAGDVLDVASEPDPDPDLDPVLDVLEEEPASDVPSDPDAEPGCRWRWEPVSCLGDGCPEGTLGHAAVWMSGYGKMLVFGGVPSHAAVGLMYDPVADTWEATAADVLGGDRPAAVWTGSRILAWWGEGSSYDPVTNTALPLSTSGDPPTVDGYHTAVWTGSEMIVWGGGPFEALSNRGARYDPVADAWSATSLDVGCPGPRRLHTAVWTGSAMIVWGGDDGTDHPTDDATNTGGAYDPVTDTWQATPVAGDCPVARHQHSAIWNGAGMIVWGGYMPYTPPTLADTGATFVPETATWTPTSTSVHVPSGRYGHSAVWTGSEMIVWGGIIRGRWGATATGSHYDPVTATWTPTTSLGAPGGRFGHSAVWTGSEMIVWGGGYEYSAGLEYRRDGGVYRCVP